MPDIRRVKVQDLNDAFEKQGIDMTVFKPNQFAALSVYHAQFLTQVTNRTKHWLNDAIAAASSSMYLATKSRRRGSRNSWHHLATKSRRVGSRNSWHHNVYRNTMKTAILHNLLASNSPVKPSPPHLLFANSATSVFLVSTHSTNIVDEHIRALLNTGNVPSTKLAKRDYNQYYHG